MMLSLRITFRIARDVGISRRHQVPSVALAEKTLNSLMPVQDRLAVSALSHVVADLLVLLIPELHEAGRGRAGTTRLADADNHGAEAQEKDEELVRHKDRVLLSLAVAVGVAMPFGIPLFPVLPSGVHAGVSRLLTP